jgi:hypothetical protein
VCECEQAVDLGFPWDGENDPSRRRSGRIAGLRMARSGRRARRCGAGRNRRRAGWVAEFEAENGPLTDAQRAEARQVLIDAGVVPPQQTAR